MAKPKRIPEAEALKVTARNERGETYLVTQNVMNRLFYLYRKDANGLSKIGKGEKNPTVFDEKMFGRTNERT